MYNDTINEKNFVVYLLEEANNKENCLKIVFAKLQKQMDEHKNNIPQRQMTTLPRIDMNSYTNKERKTGTTYRDP